MQPALGKGEDLFFSTIPVVKIQPRGYLAHRKVESLFYTIMMLNSERVTYILDCFP